MNALTFQIHLREPVLATQPESGEENSSAAYGFIPGAMVRGALIAQYQRAHPQVHLANDPEARRLFFDGAVRYLNAYPTLSQKLRMLPMPRAWRVVKDQAEDKNAMIYDFSVEANDRGLDHSGLVTPNKRSGDIKSVTSEMTGYAFLIFQLL